MSGKTKKKKSSVGYARVLEPYKALHIDPQLCSGGGAEIERSAVWSVLRSLQDPSEDSDLLSLSSALLQLASNAGWSNFYQCVLFSLLQQNQEMNARL